MRIVKNHLADERATHAPLLWPSVVYPPCIQVSRLQWRGAFTSVSELTLNQEHLNTRTINAYAVPSIQLRQNLKAPSVSHHSLWRHWPPLFYHMVRWFLPRTPCAADAVRLRSSRAFYCAKYCCLYFLPYPHHSRWTSWFSSVLALNSWCYKQTTSPLTRDAMLFTFVPNRTFGNIRHVQLLRFTQLTWNL